VRIICSDAPIDDGPQRKIRNITRDRTVTVILGHDDVGGLFPAELAQSFDDPAQEFDDRNRDINLVKVGVNYRFNWGGYGYGNGYGSGYGGGYGYR
jgi:hypothetical protein